MAEEEKQHAEIGVIYSYKDKAYFVEGNGRTNRVKDGGDANWHPAVTYTLLTGGIEDGGHLTFIRREDDFLAKFERVEA